MISFIKNFFKKNKSISIVPIVDLAPMFGIGSAYHKLYEANYDKEVLLTKEEAGELLDYLDYVSWRMNPPKK